jgi:hypothetical protein
MSVATFAFTYLPASSPEDPGNAAAAVQLPYSFYSSGEATAEGLHVTPDASSSATMSQRCVMLSSVQCLHAAKTL